MLFKGCFTISIGHSINCIWFVSKIIGSQKANSQVLELRYWFPKQLPCCNFWKSEWFDICMNKNAPVCFSVCLFVCSSELSSLPIYICLYVCLVSVCVSRYMSVYMFVYLLCVCLCIFICLPACDVCICVLVYMCFRSCLCFVCKHFSWCVCDYVSVCLSVFVCVSVFFCEADKLFVILHLFVSQV